MLERLFFYFSMRIVFFGTPDFAVASLAALREEGHDVAAVVTAPDKPAGRGQKTQVSAVKEYALKVEIEILQPANLKDENFLTKLRTYEAPVFIVVAFRMLPESVWNMPPLGTYNLHASLLPKYRGAAPINRAVMNGDVRTGVTTFKLQQEIDTGSILLQEEQEIGPETTAGELYELLKEKGGRLLAKTVNLLDKCEREGKTPVFTRQDESAVSHAPKIFKDDCKIQWEEPALVIHNQVRGLSPFPGAFTFLRAEGREAAHLKILRTRIADDTAERTNGSLFAAGKDCLLVKCGTGTLEILELQLQGKRRMSAAEFRRGFRLQGNEYLGGREKEE